MNTQNEDRPAGITTPRPKKKKSSPAGCFAVAAVAFLVIAVLLLAIARDDIFCGERDYLYNDGQCVNR